MDGHRGHGAGTPNARYQETPESALGQINDCAAFLSSFTDPEKARLALQGYLPAGSARNALDCALWDLQAKMTGTQVADLSVMPITSTHTVYTISLDTPDAMAAAAKTVRTQLRAENIKIKLGGAADILCAEAVCDATNDGAPVRLVADANEAWTSDNAAAYIEKLQSLGLSMIEQPFPSGKDCYVTLSGFSIDICADESCLDRTSLDNLPGFYTMINIKLDKTGGLTEALRLYHAARARGLKVMVGCMMGGSLAMAPAMVLAPSCEVVDLDGPLWISEDDDPPLHYRGTEITPPPSALWG